MRKFREIIKNTSIDGWIFGLSGLVAIVLSIFSFVGTVPLSEQQAIQILIGAIGLLMLAVVAQTSRRQAEFIDLKDLLGVSETLLFNDKSVYNKHVVSNVAKASRFVSDTILSPAVSPGYTPKYFDGSRAEYKKILFDRVAKGELSYRRVEVIASKGNLERTIYRLLLFEGHKFLIRHYDSPPKVIPVLNLMSFDDTAFYIRDFYPTESTEEKKNLYVREKNFSQIFKDYWNVLWNNATPLNQGGVINWVELQRISTRLGISENEFNEMVESLKKEVKQDKRNMRLN